MEQEHKVLLPDQINLRKLQFGIYLLAGEYSGIVF